MSRALELFAERPLVPEQLQQELERMARQTRMPAMLGELWAALAHDPLLAAECLARPVVAERELRRWFEERGAKSEERGAGDASALRDSQSSTLNPRSFDEWWSGVQGALGVEMDAPEFAYGLPEIAAVSAPCGSDAWTATSTIGAPNGRTFHTAVWTGSEMIVWGGFVGSNSVNTGGRYNPATHSWTPISITGAPSPRGFHTAVWTGREMIVWGDESNVLPNTGGRYNPASDTWTMVSTTNAPGSLESSTIVWTGSEMIIWGGRGNNMTNGARYNPLTDSWAAVSTTNAPTARYRHSAVWTGSEMIIWGGGTGSFGYFDTGGRYNPTTDIWTAISTADAPSPREQHTAVWTGSEMIVWGGSSSDFFNTGGQYNPATNAWTKTSTTNAPSSRRSHTAVWTGDEMIIWGGGTGLAFLAGTGGRYKPATDTWIATATTGAPGARWVHTAVWTGSEMIVWGGTTGSQTNSGGRYSIALLTISPTTQSFTATGGPGSVAVTAQGGCTWTATSNAGFITITSGSSGAGNGTVNFSVAPNTGQNARTGTLSVGGQSFTVTQSGENPVPALAGLSPGSAVAGGATFTLTVNGAGFASGAMLRWNGLGRPTTVVSATQLTAQIPASDLLTLGPAAVTVFNPAPGGGTSNNTLSFTVASNLSSVSAASFSSLAVAPEAIVAAFGGGLATQTLAAPVLPLPTVLAGTTVKVKDSAGTERLAPLFFVSRDQVNYLVPAGTADGPSVVTVTSGDGKLSLGPLPVAAVAPGLFAANANGQGVAAAVALRVRGAAQTFEPVAQFDAATGRFVAAPIDLGPEGDQVVLLLFGTGIRGRGALSAVTCTIGGVAVPVGFAAAAPGFVGLDQVNVGPLPRSLAGRGEVDVVLMVDGKEANRVRISIK